MMPLAEPNLSNLEEEYLLDAFRSGWISSLGEYINRFEISFAEFCESKFAIAVANGTVALDLALSAAGIGKGDEVIVPALTFVATAASVCHVGAIPVFVDCEPNIGTIDPKAIKYAISPKTKAIIPVHLYGHPANMDNILNIANQHGLVVIEDAAEAHGARCNDKVVGGIGTLGTFSFYGNKILTTGEGGMVVTNDEEIADKVRFLKDHAMDRTRRYWHPEIGFNYRMTNLQAALGCAQLQRYEEIINKKRDLLKWYRNKFSNVSELVFNPQSKWANPVVWLVCLILPPHCNRETRDLLIIELKNRGIDSRPYFNLICDMPPYINFRKVNSDGGGELVNSRFLADRGINLPSSTFNLYKFYQLAEELENALVASGIA